MDKKIIRSNIDNLKSSECQKYPAFFDRWIHRSSANFLSWPNAHQQRRGGTLPRGRLVGIEDR